MTSWMVLNVILTAICRPIFAQINLYIDESSILQVGGKLTLECAYYKEFDSDPYFYVNNIQIPPSQREQMYGSICCSPRNFNSTHKIYRINIPDIELSLNGTTYRCSTYYYNDGQLIINDSNNITITISTEHKLSSLTIHNLGFGVNPSSVLISSVFSSLDSSSLEFSSSVFSSSDSSSLEFSTSVFSSSDSSSLEFSSSVSSSSISDFAKSIDIPFETTKAVTIYSNTAEGSTATIALKNVHMEESTTAMGLNSNIPHYAYIIVGVSAALIFYILTILLIATILHLILKSKKASNSANKKITPVNSASPSVQMTLSPIYDEIPGQAVPQSPAPSYSDIPTLPGYFDGKIIVHTDYSYYKDNKGP